MSQKHPTDVRLRRARNTQGGGRGAGQAGPLAPRMPSPPSGKGVADSGRPISPKKGRPWGKGSWPFTSNGASGPWLTAVAPGAQHPEVSESHLAQEKFGTECGHVPKTAPFRVALSALGMLCPLRRLSGPPGILTLTGLGANEIMGVICTVSHTSLFTRTIPACACLPGVMMPGPSLHSQECPSLDEKLYSHHAGYKNPKKCWLFPFR